jgi:arylsulfatase A-like enzyme
LFQRTLYAHGSYNAAKASTDSIFPQTLESQSKATGFRKDFMKTFAFLYHLPEITKASKTDQSTFFMMSNDTTHDTMLLQEPEYVPSLEVDNTEYDKENTVRKDDEGNELVIKNGMEAYHYQVNMAAMIQLGKWMDHLRDLGVYDNTRIIIVSDHGQDIAGEIDEDYFLTYTNKDGDEIGRDVMAFNCVLLVKDFDSKGLSTEEELSTNADVPFLATEGIVDNARNPFTGSLLTTYQRSPVDLNLLYSMKWDVSENNGNRFLEAEWYQVRDNIYDIRNWQYTGYR